MGKGVSCWWWLCCCWCCEKKNKSGAKLFNLEQARKYDDYGGIRAQLDRNATGFGSKLSGGSSAGESTSGAPCGSGGGACGTPGIGPSGCTTTAGMAQEKKPTPVHKRPLLETVKDPSIPGPRGYREPGLNHPETWPYSNLMSFLPNPLAEMVAEDNNPEQSDNAGFILFEMRYNFQETTLALKIVMAQDLPAKDLSGTSDPYVRVTLLPDKKSRLETKVKRRTLNPRWNETLYFEGFSIQKLQSRVLHLHVFDYDRFTRDDSIGEVFIPLCQIDFSQTHSFWKPLKIPPKDQCGELLVSLQYQSNKSELTLTLHKARGLKAKDINGKSDPYVKIWLRFGEKRIEKCKTPVFKCTLNPVFDQTFTFNVPWEKIRECSLDIMVMDFDNIGRNELIGRLRLAGKNSSGATEAKQWQEMIAKPREVITQWHRLKAE